MSLPCSTEQDEHGNVNNILLVKAVPSPESSPVKAQASAVPANSRRRRSSARQSQLAGIQTSGRVLPGRRSSDFSDYDIPSEVFDGDDKANSPMTISANPSRSHSTTSSPHPSGRHSSMTRSMEIETAMSKINLSADKERSSRLEKFESAPNQDKVVTAAKPTSQLSQMSNHSTYADAKTRKMMTPIIEKPSQFDEIVPEQTIEENPTAEEEASSGVMISHSTSTSSEGKSASPAKRSLLERRTASLKKPSGQLEPVSGSGSDQSENGADQRASRVDSGYTSNDEISGNVAKAASAVHKKGGEECKFTDLFSELGPAAEMENHPSLNSPREELCPLFDHESRSSAEGSPITPKRKMRTMSALVREEVEAFAPRPVDDSSPEDPDRTIAIMLDETRRAQGGYYGCKPSSPLVARAQDFIAEHQETHTRNKDLVQSDLGSIREDKPAEQSLHPSLSERRRSSHLLGSPNSPFLPLFDVQSRSNRDSPEIVGGRMNATPPEELEELPLSAMSVLSNQQRRGSNTMNQKNLSPLRTGTVSSSSPRPESRKHKLEDGFVVNTGEDWSTRFPEVADGLHEKISAKTIDLAGPAALEEDMPDAKRMRLGDSDREREQFEVDDRDLASNTTAHSQNQTLSTLQTLWDHYIIGILGTWLATLFALSFGFETRGRETVKGKGQAKKEL